MGEPGWWLGGHTNASLSKRCISHASTDRTVVTEHDWIPAGVLDYQNGLCGSMHDLVGMKGKWEGGGGQAGQDQHPGVGELKQEDSASRGIGWDRREAVEAVKRVNQLIYDSLNRRKAHRQSMPWPWTLDPRLGRMSAGVPEVLGAGVWGQRAIPGQRLLRPAFLSAGCLLGGWGGLWLAVCPKTVTAETLRKRLLFLCLISSLLVLGFYLYFVLLSSSFSLLWWFTVFVISV